MKIAGWYSILAAFTAAAALAAFGYVQYSNHRAFHAQAQIAVDALQRLDEHVGDGTMWYEPADAEAEKQVQSLSHLHANYDEQILAVDVESELQSIRMERDSESNAQELLESEKELAHDGGNPDFKPVKDEMAVAKNASDIASACLNDLELRLSSNKRDPRCTDSIK